MKLQKLALKNKVQFVEQIKSKFQVPVKEITIGEGFSFLFFQIGSDPYYIKITC